MCQEVTATVAMTDEIDLSEFSRIFWGQKWDEWRDQNPNGLYVPGDVKRKWREELRMEIQKMNEGGESE